MQNVKWSISDSTYPKKCALQKKCTSIKHAILDIVKHSSNFICMVAHIASKTIINKVSFVISGSFSVPYQSTTTFTRFASCFDSLIDSVNPRMPFSHTVLSHSCSRCATLSGTEGPIPAHPSAMLLHTPCSIHTDSIYHFHTIYSSEDCTCTEHTMLISIFNSWCWVACDRWRRADGWADLEGRCWSISKVTGVRTEDKHNRKGCYGKLINGGIRWCGTTQRVTVTTWQ